MSKPSEDVVRSTVAGIEVTDSIGRKIILKDSNLLERYYLYSALGKDTMTPICINIANVTLSIASINGVKFNKATSYEEIMANLQRMGDEGFIAVSEKLASLNSGSPEEDVQEIKK